MENIIYNAIECKNCKDIIESYHRHDFKYCSCGNVSVDGGTEYLRRGYINDMAYTELALYSNNPFEIIRQYLKWGKNYDENMERLPETEWIPLKDLNDGHLDALADYKPASTFYRVMFIQEKLWRAEQEY